MQVNKKKPQVKRETEVEEVQPTEVDQELAEKTSQVIDDIDDVLEDQLDAELLAAMDDVLEEDAQQFVDNYIQAGGE